MPIPPALLRRLYVEGSLRNRRDGFEFTLRNRLTPGTLLQLGPLTVDGRRYEGDNLLLHTRKSTRPAEKIAAASPLDWPINVDITLIGVGPRLAAETHTLTLDLILRQAGKATLTIEDTLTSSDPAPPAPPA